MIVRNNEQVFIYNNCIPLIIGFVLALLFHALCFLFMIMQKDLTWWHILIGGLGMLMSFAYLVLNILGWHKKVKRLPIAYCDDTHLQCLHPKRWAVNLEDIDSILLYKYKGGKSIDIILHDGESKRLISPASFVSDTEEIHQALCEQHALYGGVKD